MADLFWLSDERWTVVDRFMPINQPGARRVDDRRVGSGTRYNRVHIRSTAKNRVGSAMPQPRSSSNSFPVAFPEVTEPKRGRAPLSDSQLTDGEFRRLAAKRLNEVRRARIALCNIIGTTLFVSALIGVGTLEFLVGRHEWSGAEIAAIAVLSCAGLGMIALASKIASRIGSEE